MLLVSLYLCGVAVVFCAVLLIFPRLFPTETGLLPVGGGGGRRSGNSPQEAVELYAKALQDADLEAYVDLLARDARGDMREFLAWNSRCADVDTNLELEFVRLSGAEPAPPIPGRAFNVRRILEYNAGKFQITASRVHADGHVELSIRSVRGTLSEKAEETTFLAVKEDTGWKLAPPQAGAFGLAVPQLKRYVEAKESVLAKARAGQFKTRAEAVAALSDALRPEATVPGSPEDALARYEATYLAGDIQGHIGNLAQDGRTYYLDMIANARRRDEVYKAYYTALYERFGYDSGSAFFLKPFDESFMSPGFIRHDLLGKTVHGPDVVELQVMSFFWNEFGSFIIEKTFFAVKEDGAWKIAAADPEDKDARAEHQKAMAALRQFDEPQMKMLEQLTTDVRAGKYPDRDSVRAAHREARERQRTEREEP